MLADGRAAIAWTDTDGHRPMIRAGTIRRVSSWLPDPDRFPRFPLLDGRSPLAPVARFSAALGDRMEVWIKREDLLPLAFGGNKLRNLEFLVGAALAEGADSVVTSGRRWSNHARLTAAAGAKAGLDVHLVLSGPPVDPPNPGIRLDEILGATVHQVATDDRAERAATVDRVVGDLRADGHRPYLVGIGGTGIVGAVGQVLAGLELSDEAAASGLDPDMVVVASATGVTQAGVLVGLRTAGRATAVHGFAVTPVEPVRTDIAAVVAGLGAIDGLAVVEDGDIVVDGSQLGPGYGRRTEAADEATRMLARTEGILVDPIYTAKAMAGLIALARDGTLDGRRVVFWHAGGTPGLFEPLDR
jgi:1-aminocyclopropane-1-carboxylate deaminase/D-cysteine desulfhydrase-like pyridoxal-dependent ACC family enzyme